MTNHETTAAAGAEETPEETTAAAGTAAETTAAAGTAAETTGGTELLLAPATRAPAEERWRRRGRYKGWPYAPSADPPADHRPGGATADGADGTKKKGRPRDRTDPWLRPSGCYKLKLAALYRKWHVARHGRQPECIQAARHYATWLRGAELDVVMGLIESEYGRRRQGGGEEASSSISAMTMPVVAALYSLKTAEDDAVAAKLNLRAIWLRKMYDHKQGGRVQDPDFRSYEFFERLLESYKADYFRAAQARDARAGQARDARAAQATKESAHRAYWRYFTLALYVLQPALRAEWGEMEVVDDIATALESEGRNFVVVHRPGGDDDALFRIYLKNKYTAKFERMPGMLAELDTSLERPWLPTLRRYTLVINKDKVSKSKPWREEWDGSRVIPVTDALADVLDHSFRFWPEGGPRRAFVLPKYDLRTARDRTDYSRPLGRETLKNQLRRVFNLEAPLDGLRRAWATKMYTDETATYNDMKATAHAMRHSLATALLQYRRAAVPSSQESGRLVRLVTRQVDEQLRYEMEQQLETQRRLDLQRRALATRVRPPRPAAAVRSSSETKRERDRRRYHAKSDDDKARQQQAKMLKRLRDGAARGRPVAAKPATLKRLAIVVEEGDDGVLVYRTQPRKKPRLATPSAAAADSATAAATAAAAGLSTVVSTVVAPLEAPGPARAP